MAFNLCTGVYWVGFIAICSLEGCTVEHGALQSCQTLLLLDVGYLEVYKCVS